MIRVTGVSKYYGKFRALDHLHFVIGAGECVVFLGPNGSGKSTLYRCLLGITSYQGSIRIGDNDPLADGKAVRKTIGYMPQHTSLHEDMTVGETLAFYAELRGDTKERAISQLDRIGLKSSMGLKVGELSGGMKQRLTFVTALIGDPDILLLDEPTANMDEKSQHLLHRWLMELKEEGRTILISTHFHNGVLSLADRTITLEEGRIRHMTLLDHFEARGNHDYHASIHLAVVGA